MEFTYTVTYPEWRQIQEMGRRRFRIARLVGDFFIIALTLVSLVMVGTGRWKFQDVQTFFVLEAVLILLMITVRFRQRRQWKEMLLSNLLVKIDDAGIQCTRPGKTESLTRWTGITRYAEGRELFVFYISDRMVIPLPKRVMTEQQQSELRTLISRSVPELAARS